MPALQRCWRLPDFAAALALANAIGALAERLNHHPELLVGWGCLTVRWTTHDAGGITALDAQAARETDAIATATALGAPPA